MPGKKKTERRTTKKGSSKPNHLRLSDRVFETKRRAFDAITKMRHDDLPLDAAARAANTTPATIRKYLPATLRKTKTGHWVATKSDRYVRVLSLPGPHGPVIVRARGSEEARFASAYLTSLTRWARTEKAYELGPFHGKKIGGYQLV